MNWLSEKKTRRIRRKKTSISINPRIWFVNMNIYIFFRMHLSAVAFGTDELTSVGMRWTQSVSTRRVEFSTRLLSINDQTTNLSFLSLSLYLSNYPSIYSKKLSICHPSNALYAETDLFIQFLSLSLYVCLSLPLSLLVFCPVDSQSVILFFFLRENERQREPHSTGQRETELYLSLSIYLSIWNKLLHQHNIHHASITDRTNEKSKRRYDLLLLQYRFHM